MKPSVSSTRMYAGADPPARLSLEIDTIAHQGESVPVLTRDVLHLPFCVLTRLGRADRTHLPKVLIVAPLSGHFPILLRDLVIGLLPSFQVFVTDWVNARHVALDQGAFDLEKNVSYIVDMIGRLGPGLNVLALCQAALPTLVATAHLSETREPSAPRTLALVAAPVDPAANLGDQE